MAASELPSTGDGPPTQGSGEGGFVAVDVQGAGRLSGKVEAPQEVSSKGSTPWDLAKNPENLFKSVKEHFPTVAIIVSLVGYVLIAAFGHDGMWLGGLVMYLCFLIFLYFLYSFLSAPAAVKEGIKSINRFFGIGFLILLGIVVFQNWEWISHTWDSISGALMAPAQQPVVSPPSTNGG